MTDADLIWSVAWEVASPPPELMPAAPEPPAPPADDSAEAAQEYADAQARYQQAMDVVYHQTLQVLADEQWWSTTRTEFVSEAAARETLPTMIRANASSPFARNFHLETSPPRVWTPTS
ncbi:hypothetical protein ABQF35_14190 [Mycobacterium syngnathidarum]